MQHANNAQHPAAPKHPIDTTTHYNLRASANCAAQLEKLLNVTGGQRIFAPDELRAIKLNAEQLQRLHAAMVDDLAFMIASVDSLADEAA